MKKPSNNGLVKIEKNVPVTVNHHGTQQKYPWDKLNIGESFLTNCAKTTSVASTRHHWQMKTGFKFITRTTPEGVRVWRVS